MHAVLSTIGEMLMSYSTSAVVPTDSMHHAACYNRSSTRFLLRHSTAQIADYHNCKLCQVVSMFEGHKVLDADLLLAERCIVHPVLLEPDSVVAHSLQCTSMHLCGAGRQDDVLVDACRRS